ncbi:hypothetical protein [Geosporobacter ferrireducens]|uniref:Uncharacterized protein n=1 Tax=Geosporobacter ferrireducens TaxID=1424294 RepID=A0A1D8GDU6_9FIRM|nr:hypothetical protein [Geosporobacter ferrireducens]AOT69077.1 hypothetical protein Gferi_05590 [Geosporobacter ferrireducens]MTI56749.1 hypothetical protein [Geosporobacter ferrireducens]
MNRLIPILLVIIIVFAAATYLLHRIFLRRRWIKYIPGIAALGTCIYHVIMIRTGQYNGFEDLARILMGIMLFSGFIGGLLTGLILDFIRINTTQYNTKDI